MSKEPLIPVGAVQETKNELDRKQVVAEAETPVGMELVGWMLDGWVAGFTLLDDTARPVYAYKKEVEEGE